MMPRKWLAPAGLAALALVVTACGGNSSPNSPGGAATTTPAAPASSPASSSAMVKSAQVSGITVLTNASGFTVYWFAKDSMNKSNCSGSCATYWPPVKGPVTAGSGVTGTFGTTKRSDGTLQATWNGHPLYTYLGDSAAGQDNGNGKTASGGLWWAAKLSGSSSPSSSTGGGGGGGYGAGASPSSSGGGGGW